MEASYESSPLLPGLVIQDSIGGMNMCALNSHGQSLPWRDLLDSRHPGLLDCQRRVQRLPEDRFPAAAELNDLLPGGVSSRAGAAISFVDSETLGAVDYEQHIHRLGEVSTRAMHWHDLFNALVWCRFPVLKTTLNHLHVTATAQAQGRGAQRDALTLLDESGAVVCSPHRELLQALAQRQWHRAFVELRTQWADSRMWICGHAILEKLVQPYKALTAHCLLLHDPGGVEVEKCPDETVASLLEVAQVLPSPRALSPLPLAGIPGWWPDQDAVFYQDDAVFRTAQRPFTSPPIHPLG